MPGIKPPKASTVSDKPIKIKLAARLATSEKLMAPLWFV